MKSIAQCSFLRRSGRKKKQNKTKNISQVQNFSNGKWNEHGHIPLEEHGFFEGTSEARFLVAQTLTGVTMLPRTINFIAPIKVLLMANAVPGLVGGDLGFSGFK